MPSKPAHTTDAMWYFWQKLQQLEPSSQFGGTYAPKPGYHSYRSRLPSNDYSIQSKADKGGPGDKSAGVDWTFPNAQRADYQTIAKYSDRLLRSGRDVNDPRCDVLREFYGQADRDTYVEGYDFQARENRTSDPSHLWHIHFSFLRNQVTSKAAMDGVLSVLRGERYPVPPLKEEDMLYVSEQIPHGFAYDPQGNLVDASKKVEITLPLGVDIKDGWLSFSCDDSSVKLRYAMQEVDSGWDVKHADVSPDNRVHATSYQVTKSYGKISVGRQDPGGDDQIVRKSAEVAPCSVAVAK